MTIGQAPGERAVSDFAPPKVVLITGVTRPIGARLAARLAGDPSIERIVGIDAHEPSEEVAAALPERLEFHRVDPERDGAGAVLSSSGAQAVVHLAIVTNADGHAGGRTGMKEQNVIGTMQLLAACQQSPDLRKIVLRSSTAAYGASFRDPAVFTEDTEPRAVPRGGFARDVLDIEGYVRGFRRRRPDVAATVLRFAPFIGETATTSLTHYFANPVVPTILGRDPRLQFVHADDAMEILYRAVTQHHPGTYNVAGPGTITLSQAVRRAGRIPVPVVEAGMSVFAGLAGNLWPRGFSFDQLDLFVHGRVVDIGALVAEFGFQPRSTAEAFGEFLQSHRTGAPLPRESVRAAERAILEQIRSLRSAASAAGAVGGHR